MKEKRALPLIINPVGFESQGSSVGAEQGEIPESSSWLPHGTETFGFHLFLIPVIPEMWSA